MATTSNTYTGNGSNRLFTITFPYLDTTDIDVYLNGTLQTVTTEYTFANATTVEFVTAPGAGTTVLLNRSTDDITLAATFFAGSSIRAADLNENFDQVLYIAQETNNNVANAVAGQIPDGTITSNKIANDTIVDADVNSTAGILASKLSFTQSGTGATARTIDSKLKDTVSVKDFGAVGDGVTDDSTALNNAITYVKTYGLELFVPAGIYICKNLRLESGVKAWAMRGAGKDLTVFQHLDGNGTLIIGNNGSSVPYELSDFTVDCRFAETAHASANNAISFADTLGVVLRRIKVQNYKNNGILGFASVSNTFGQCIGEECEAIGNGATTNNGLLFAEMPFCKWINCRAKNILGSPAYGIQLKNDSRWGQITNGYAETCKAGIAFGTDTVGLGAQNCIVEGFQSAQCLAGIVLGEAKYCSIKNLIIDMNNAVENAIDFNANSIGCSIYATVRNVNALRSAVRVRSGATDNYVSLDTLDNINTTGKAATFDTGALRNNVKVARVTNPTSLANGPRAWVIFTTASNNNSFELLTVPYQDVVTISSGIITLANAIPNQLVAVDTEASTVVDDLDTITNTFAVEAQQIIVRTVNDARDVVIKHDTGNIILSGSADLTLPTRRSMLCLTWSNLNSKWNESWRVINP